MQSLGSLLLVGCLAGAVSAGGALYFSGDSSPSQPADDSRPETANTLPTDDEQVRALIAEVSTLRREVGRLRQELSRRMDARPAPTRAARLEVEGSDTVTGEARGPLEAPQLAAVIEEEDSPVRKAVAQIVEDEFNNRREEWRLRRRARHEARDEQRVARLADATSLVVGDQEKILRLLEGERKRVSDTRSEARETLDFAGLRDRVREIRKETDQKVNELLDGDGREEWKTIRSQRRGRGFH